MWNVFSDSFHAYLRICNPNGTVNSWHITKIAIHSQPTTTFKMVSLSLSHCINDIRESHNTCPYQVPVLAQINNIITSSCICYFGLPYSLLLAVIIHPSLPYLRECSLLSYKKCLSNSTCLLTYRYFVTEKNWEKTKENAEPKWQQFLVLKSF